MMLRPTFAAVMEACERDDNTGFCLACGAEQTGVEPDAQRVRCEDCGNDAVAGAEQLLLTGWYER